MGVESSASVAARSRASGGVVALASLLLFGLASVVYAPVRDHAFIHYDDRGFIEENDALRHGLSLDGVRAAFTATTDGNWLPLTWLSFLVDEEIHGLSPSGTHASNVVLHALSSVLLFLALLRLTGAPGPSGFAAAVFAVHPLHVESVAWAIERKDVLSGLCFHAMLVAYAGYARAPNAKRGLAVLACLGLGLLAKPMLVTAPFLLLVLDYWPLRRMGSAVSRRRALAEKLPMFVLVAVVSGITLWAQQSVGSMSSDARLPLLPRLENAVVSYAVYLRRAVWPSDLSIFYVHPATRGGVPSSQLASAAALLVAISVLCAWQWRRRPHWLAGWLWYLGMLLPVIGLVQVGTQAMADRYTYLPLTGVVLAISWEAATLAQSSRAARSIVVGAAVIAVALQCVATRRQLATWRSGLSVFEHAIAADERNAVAQNGTGFALLELGRVHEAIARFERALELEPEAIEAQVNLGAALLEAGMPGEAVAHLERGLALPPHRLARVHGNLGLAHQRSGRKGAAIEHYRRALDYDADSAVLRANLGALLLDDGRLREAGPHLEAAERLGLDTPDFQLVLAKQARSAGLPREAEAHYRRALEFRPDWVSALNDLAWLLATDADVRRPAEAVVLAERASRATGDVHPSVLATLSAAYASAGRRGDAIAAGEAAARRARAVGDLELARRVDERLEALRAADPPGS